jgi:hypothetical protein
MSMLPLYEAVVKAIVSSKSQIADLDCRELTGTLHTNYYDDFLPRFKRRKHLFESTFPNALWCVERPPPWLR